MDQRTRRSPARFLAPLALIAVLVAFLAIVTSSGGGGGSSTDESTTTRAVHTSTTTKKKKTSSQTKNKTTATDTGSAKTYTVQVGDTLGAIADKTGVPLQHIEELNPNVDPHAMVTGQEIRLK